jgi:hypothetical protein
MLKGAGKWDVGFCRFMSGAWCYLYDDTTE